MVVLGSSILQAGVDVLWFKIGKIFQDFGLGNTGCQHFQNILHANSHASDARTTATLAWFDGDAIEKFGFHRCRFGYRFKGQRENLNFNFYFFSSVAFGNSYYKISPFYFQSRYRTLFLHIRISPSSPPPCSLCPRWLILLFEVAAELESHGGEQFVLEF